MNCLAKKLIANSCNVDNQGIIYFEKSLQKRYAKKRNIINQKSISMRKLKFLFTLFLLLCNVVLAAQEFKVGGICYKITDDVNFAVEVVSGESKYTGDVVIPAVVEYEGRIYNVTSIGAFAFRECTELTSVVIPNSVTKINEGSFSFCNMLANVEVPNSVTYIGPGAFYYCLSLRSFEIPNSVTFIDGYAFAYCSSLTSIEIPSSVAYVEEGTFYECPALKCVISFISPEQLFALEIFTFDYLSDCVLYVPAGAKGVYVSTEGWDNFSDIIELDSTGVSEIPFTGFEGLFDVYYDLQGRVVENPVKGVYILNGTKILVK